MQELRAMNLYTLKENDDMIDANSCTICWISIGVPGFILVAVYICVFCVSNMHLYKYMRCDCENRIFKCREARDICNIVHT